MNNTVSTTIIVTNSSSISYYFGSSLTPTTRTSSITFTLQPASTLPPTGFAPLDTQENRWKSVGLVVSLLLGWIAVCVLAYSLWAKISQRSRADRFFKIGLSLAAIAFVLGMAAWLVKAEPGTGIQVSLATEPTPTSVYVGTLPVQLRPSPLPGELSTPLALETLPSYPIPTPKITATAQPGESQVDTSPVTRMLIPNLGVDAEVKYVPFSGLTWLISGLQYEIAWMGETSWPGLGGNTGLAGHVTLRNGAAGPLYNLYTVKPGDQVILYTEQNEYIYTVREQRLVEETDLTVLAPSDRPQLTLVTCDEWNTTMKLYLKRRILFADLKTVLPLVRGY